MAQRSSQVESDEVVWQTASIPLGRAGLDLRASGEASLTRLDNARFSDERTVERRNGHVGQVIRDASDYYQADDGDDQSVPMGGTGWVYGHGQVIATGPLVREDAHLPAPGVARGTFRFEGHDVVWTGDRVLVARDGLRALGQSHFWGVDSDTLPLARGCPAYLPVQVDSAPPEAVNSLYVETCLTDSLRVVVADSGTELIAWVIDRDSGATINRSDLGGNSNASEIRVFESGAYVVCLWRDSVTKTLYINYWTGVAWNGASTIDTAVDAYDVAPVQGGFHLLWRVGADLFLGKYSGKTTQPAPYDFQTDVSSATANAGGAVAVAVAPNDDVCVVFQTDSSALNALIFNPSLTAVSEFIVGTGVHDAGLTVTSRALSCNEGSEAPRYPFVIHAGLQIGAVVKIFELNDGGPVDIFRTGERYNSKVASKSFRVGNEVFCWLKANNSSTLYLVGGVRKPQVSGIADREVAGELDPGVGGFSIAMVNRDPRSEMSFTWARTYNTGNSFKHGGNARIGDLEFLPSLSAVQYGDSVYLAGSHPRNWDGTELGDAGFHDYPIVASGAGSDGAGTLTALGTYRVRVYPVRYNRRGERFIGAAVTSSPVTLTGAQDTITWTINTLPVTNHEDVVFEVYRTIDGGTTYYLEGVVANSLTAGTVQFVSTVGDGALDDLPGDPHATGVASTNQLVGFGPLGCSHFAAYADRLWGAGGQVPRGWVQFSKLKESVKGAGFDALAGTQQIDTEGGEITSLVGSGDALIAFERRRLYALYGAGPNNFGAGAFSVPQLVLADGATTHLGTGVTQIGVVYWGDGGPRLLTHGLKVESISAPVMPLSSTLEPTGVQVDLARQEVVWYTSGGTALLMNYRAGVRWARWTGLEIAGCSNDALVTTDGVLLTPTADVDDAGYPFAFTAAFSRLRPEDILRGHTLVRRVGIAGEHHGPHEVRFRVSYDGAPLWSEEFTWEPETNTWLVSAEDVGDLTPEQFDALVANDHSGSYGTDKRLRRQTCRHIQVEISDVSAHGPTFTPHELVFELGMKPGLGRTAVNTFGD